MPRRVTVVGAGTIGSGIALAFAIGGVEVSVMSRRELSIEDARRRIRESLEILEQHGGLAGADPAAVLSRIRATTQLDEAVAGAELVVESIAEVLVQKQTLLAQIERLIDDDVVLTTGTSSLSVAELATSLRRPERFVGFHWFNPPELVPLVEIVSGPLTSLESSTRLVNWATAIGKVAVRLRRDVPGFIANRLQYALLREAFALVDGGVCSYADVDTAVKAALGARWAAVGPFESLDLAGLDVHLAVATQIYPELARGTDPSHAVVKLVGAGALGCKSGRGLYGDYTDEVVGELVQRRAKILLGLSRIV